MSTIIIILYHQILEKKKLPEFLGSKTEEGAGVCQLDGFFLRLSASIKKISWNGSVKPI